MADYVIQLENITKSYDDNTILENFYLNVERGEFLTLLGPSGCGKTTTLRLIGGFEAADSGKVLFNGEDIGSKEPYERNINTVFQNYALFPHMNVFDNVAFGLKIKKKSKEEIEKKVNETLRIVGLQDYGKRKIDALSGGQQQRVAIARALVNEPEVILLDEPLGALDLKLRQEMQVELKKIQKKVNITFIYVTHDQEEALSMSDKIVVMNHGKIEQLGTPIDIYNEPKNAFVADFIGESNIIDGVMKADYQVAFLNHTFPCVDKGFSLNQKVQVVVRPEDIDMAETGQIYGVVKSEIFKGVHYDIEVEVEGMILLAQSTKSYRIGSTVGISVDPDLIHVMGEL
ncbi:ABC transporter ATP-binding protein [Peptoniphilus equinus]|uniref:Spermidine/putrescine import ATP-binding protein PotA n=1 Tax=Peptoniphilus equinus TaxID=3016343 RepID=A0ABY7QSF8_9FIRM|nr:ABC transporter ATP-binding protein [Peptoniphilus equinus]WBW49728.1 ABC transporter ATP-binding protein [Peptoniphilus equinus]